MSDSNELIQMLALQQIREAIGDPHGKLMQDEVVERARELVAERDALAAHAASLTECFDDLIASSEGVTGLHGNGEIAPWGDLTEGGRFEEWLLPLSQSPGANLAEVKAQAIESFAASVHRDSIHKPTLVAIAKHYADRIRKEAQ
ncbi:hypothetical protein HNR62_001080 [Oceanisphaera litoralis]|uniref:hypothetical protein n=1 Tax=Oceanisphaera litoralis TaxID=225144 RepID=UPI0019573E7B|nr:hypothetical protein [Oceanisphaera litoralis]MBM7455220.1 hypothetical protein [Oceanisphaera litoralis]